MADSSENLIGLNHRSVMPTFRTQGGDALFYVAITVFVAGILSYGGLFIYQKTLDRQLADLSAEVGKKSRSLTPDLIRPIVDLHDKIVSAKDLIDKHVMPLNVFALLSKNTLPNVSFGSFSYSADTRQIALSAQAASYAALADQIGLFESLPDFETVDFGGLSLDPNGLVSFKITIVFKPSLLLKSNAPAS
ncbi:hypothetical protein KGQ34_01210 [Patescibacteria group bacterium]|nr:hypothetical protein [Patescibacteria group bacterium]